MQAHGGDAHEDSHETVGAFLHAELATAPPHSKVVCTNLPLDSKVVCTNLPLDGAVRRAAAQRVQQRGLGHATRCPLGAERHMHRRATGVTGAHGSPRLEFSAKYPL